MSSACEHIWHCTRSSKGGMRSWYAAIIQRLAFPALEKHAVTKTRFMKCEECEQNNAGLSNLAMHSCCTKCNTFACISHIKRHLQEKDHIFAMSLETGHIYCNCCHDFVYDRILEVIRMEYFNTYRRRLGLPRVIRWWNPSKEEFRAELAFINRTKLIPMRGFYNLGNTCFLNVIVQALANAPNLRDYFLSRQHVCSADRKDCILCEMQYLVEKLNSQEGPPAIAPVYLLSLVWLNSHMCGEGQQDAHEFFLIMLDIMHRHSKGEAVEPSNSMTPAPCDCIVDKTFTGVLQSDITCDNCGYVSSTRQPFLDISLQVTPSNNPHHIGHITDCLKQYTCSERVEANCSNCNSNSVTKQCSFVKLPIVVVIHLKRFEHGGNKSASKSKSQGTTKIESELCFDVDLDMQPYTNVNQKDIHQQFYFQDNGRAVYKHSYKLFAVVNHLGSSIESGHYISFVRRGPSSWYMCSDDSVQEVSEQDVLFSQAYLLFFHANHLN